MLIGLGGDVRSFFIFFSKHSFLSQRVPLIAGAPKAAAVQALGFPEIAFPAASDHAVARINLGF